MSANKGLVSKASLTAIGDAIREKNKTTTQYSPSEMAQAIKDIEGDKIVVTTGDKYTLKVIDPTNGEITSSLQGKAINNSDGTISVGLTDNSTYTPNTGYDPGVILRSFNKDTNLYIVTGTAASPTSVIDDNGFARMYAEISTYSAYLYPLKTYSGEKTDLMSASGKIFIAGSKSTQTSPPSRIYFSPNIQVYFDPVSTNIYGGITPPSDNAGNEFLEYISLPNFEVNNFAFGCYRAVAFRKLKYADFGFIKGFKEFHLRGVNLETLILRNTESIVPLTDESINFYESVEIKNLYVPSSLLSAYKGGEGWPNFVTNFIALEGSKYEDPYAFIKEIGTSST